MNSGHELTLIAGDAGQRELIEEINKLHAECMLNLHRTLESAIRIGQLLAAPRKRLGMVSGVHGFGKIARSVFARRNGTC